MSKPIVVFTDMGTLESFLAKLLWDQWWDIQDPNVVEILHLWPKAPIKIYRGRDNTVIECVGMGRNRNANSDERYVPYIQVRFELRSLEKQRTELIVDHCQHDAQHWACWILREMAMRWTESAQAVLAFEHSLPLDPPEDNLWLDLEVRPEHTEFIDYCAPRSVSHDTTSSVPSSEDNSVALSARTPTAETNTGSGPTSEAHALPPIVDPVDERIWKIVASDPDMTDRQIGQQLNLSRQVVNSRRRRLAAMGYKVR